MCVVQVRIAKIMRLLKAYRMLRILKLPRVIEVLEMHVDRGILGIVVAIFAGVLTHCIAAKCASCLHAVLIWNTVLIYSSCVGVLFVMLGQAHVIVC